MMSKKYHMEGHKKDHKNAVMGEHVSGSKDKYKMTSHGEKYDEQGIGNKGKGKGERPDQTRQIKKVQCQECISKVN
jgi:hypothetical protein